MHRIILTLGAVALSLVVFAARISELRMGLPQISLFSSKPTPTSWPFDPARYDVPDTIAGHKVLAVISADNIMCTPPHLLTLVVRAGSPDPQSYPGSDEAKELNAAMNEFSHPGWTWVLNVIGPGVSLDNWQAEAERWNQAQKISGCEPLQQMRDEQVP